MPVPAILASVAGIPGWAVSQSVSLFQSVARRMMFRPAFDFNRPRCKEKVAVGIEYGIALRGWVYGGNSEPCQVFLLDVDLDGDVIDNQRTQLRWTDQPLNAQFAPLVVHAERKDGVYFDIATAVSSALIPASLKGQAGQRFLLPGTYAARLRLERIGGSPKASHEHVVRFAFQAGDLSACGFER